jgi:hypothetical protein
MSRYRRPLPELAARIQERYPGVRVIEAHIAELCDGTMRQMLRYQAPLATLKAHGLVTDDMLEYARRNDGRRRRPRPASGDGFVLYERLDARSVAECWELLVFTDATAPDEKRICLRDARRLLKSLGAAA